MKTCKIVLTGGPCAGKTTSIQTVVNRFTEKGYRVLVVPESATILINSGIRSFGNHALSKLDFQCSVISLQLLLEHLAEEATLKDDVPTIILCDRGILDSKSFVSDDDWQKMLKIFDTTDLTLMNRYDLVIHLRTVAMGKEEFYTLDNNMARVETKEQAKKQDQKTLNAWLGHENLFVIGNEMSFEEKIERVISEIYYCFGKPYLIQTQRKYLVDVSLEKINEIKFVKLDIEQYVLKNDDVEYIYRKTKKDDDVRYTVITKLDTDIDNERIIKRRQASEEEYNAYYPLENIVIRKTRYCFEFENQYFRLDVFEHGLQVLETELSFQDQQIVIPEFITVKKEVTYDKNYRNSFIFNNLNVDRKGKIKKYIKVC